MRTTRCTLCKEIAHARRLCRRHYGQARAAGTLPPLVLKELGMTDEERFFSRVSKDGSSCWLWIGGISSTGYGSFKPSDSSASNAHRWSYQHHVGPIPEGLYLDHVCRVRHCVNPDHLEPVTNAENIRRGEARESAARRAAALTHCPKGHEKTEENVYRSFNAKRNRWESVCRPCRNARLRRRKEALRDAS